MLTTDTFDNVTRSIVSIARDVSFGVDLCAQQPSRVVGKTDMRILHSCGGNQLGERAICNQPSIDLFRIADRLDSFSGAVVAMFYQIPLRIHRTSH
ncbi:hypothetical protein WL95_12500 [Burkholderia cepacia]|nr:hypothetical protein WL95_12500 [Burkholderia cepacia]